jgi:hypothetical protein
MGVRDGNGGEVGPGVTGRGGTCVSKKLMPGYQGK